MNTGGRARSRLRISTYSYPPEIPTILRRYCILRRPRVHPPSSPIPIVIPSPLLRFFPSPNSISHLFPLSEYFWFSSSQLLHKPIPDPIKFHGPSEVQYGFFTLISPFLIPHLLYCNLGQCNSVRLVERLELCLLVLRSDIM